MNSAHIKKIQKKILNQAVRDDFKLFLRRAFYEMHGKPMRWNWHHDVICDALVNSYSGDDRRLILNVPPRSLKSFICSVAFPAWVMGLNPRANVIGVSYAQDLASKFSRMQRTLMMSAWYRDVFPDANVNPKKAGEAEFELTKGGCRLATSTGGILTGRGADFIFVDDPIKPQDALSETIRNNANDWISNTLVTRLDDKQKGVIAMIMQRIHEEDPTGYLLEKGGWKHFSFPAIAVEDEVYKLSTGNSFIRKEGDLLHPDHETLDTLNRLKIDMGSMHFNAQYQQQPIPVEGNLIKTEWIRRYRTLPYESKRYVLSVDTG